MIVDLSRIEESKRRMRRRLAALPFAEKLHMVERLRERSLSLATARLKKEENIHRRQGEEPVIPKPGHK